MSAPSRALAITVALAAFTLAASPASARIVVGKSIAGVALEMTRSEVVAAKGEPDAERIVKHEIFGKARIMRYGKTRIGFAGRRADSQVVVVSTTARGQKTGKGVGVGSRERAVKRKVSGARCRSEFGIRHCWKGRFLPGRRVTDFRISKKNRRVTRVTVGFVID